MANLDHAAQTQTPDHVYDLILVLQQALEDCVRYEAFAQDAEGAGDRELATWFRDLSASDREIATRAKTLLRKRLD